jgi:hypothetical protein
MVSVELHPSDWETILLLAELHSLLRFSRYVKKIEQRMKKPTKRLPRDLRSFADSLLALRAFKVALHNAGVTEERDTSELDDLLLMLTARQEAERKPRHVSKLKSARGGR